MRTLSSRPEACLPQAGTCFSLRRTSVSASPSSPHLGVRLALFALRFYKLYLSTLIGGSCRFQPTCSVYAYEAIERFGVLKGSWLALKRLLRCHPLSRKFGFDPVPEQEAHS